MNNAMDSVEWSKGRTNNTNPDMASTLIKACSPQVHKCKVGSQAWFLCFSVPLASPGKTKKKDDEQERRVNENVTENAKEDTTEKRERETKKRHDKKQRS